MRGAPERLVRDDLVGRILDGDERAAGRLMRMADDGAAAGRRALDALYSHAGHARVVGVTGNPGSGKSTLVDALIREFRAAEESVGVVAIDPTSPFSGGAILGDRVRMGAHATDPGVFIRSVATRGNLGGISRSTPAIMEILDAMGFDWIIVETVGVGQDEVDVAAFSDVCVVVMVPGLGDDVQAAKAGILEIADIFVVNKSDRPDARRVVRDLRTMLDVEGRDVRPPIIETVATEGAGVDELVRSLRNEVSEERVVARRSRRRRHETRLLAGGELLRRVDDFLESEAGSALLGRIESGEISPFGAADVVVNRLTSLRGDDE